jgi:hypothetical protein
MKETQRRMRISTDQQGGGGEGVNITSPTLTPTPIDSRLLDRYLKTT